MLFFQKKKEKKDSRNIILHLCIKNLDMIYSSWVIEHEGLKLVIVGHFLPFTHLRPQKISFEKMKNLLEISSFYICVPKNHKHMMLGSWDTEWDVQNFLSYWAIFCPFTPPPTPPPNNQENQNFEKIKKALADVVLLHVCTLYGDQMMYGSWDIKHNEQNFLSFWAIFCPFTPLKTKKIFFWKNET